MDADDLASAAQATAGFSACDLGATACDAVLGVMNEALAADRSADIVRIPLSLAPSQCFCFLN